MTGVLKRGGKLGQRLRVGRCVGTQGEWHVIRVMCLQAKGQQSRQRPPETGKRQKEDLPLKLSRRA